MSKNKQTVKKSKILGMPFATARSKLMKIILFNILKKNGLDICFRCKKEISNIDNLTIEHKVAWLNSDNPVELFFDFSNIAFSHQRCNSSARAGSQRRPQKEGYLWCWCCKQLRLIKEFPDCAIRDKSKQCKKCASTYRAKYRKDTGKR